MIKQIDKKWFVLAGVAVFFVLLVYVMTSDEVVELVPDEEAVAECVDINNASHEELVEIVHIGEERANLIIENRPFESVEELEEIEGIGSVIVEDILEQGLACVEN